MSERISLNPGRVVHRVVDGELMILDIDRSEYVRGNGSLALVWPLIMRGCELSEVVASLREHYDVDRVEATRSAESLCEDVRARGWID